MTTQAIEDETKLPKPSAEQMSVQQQLVLEQRYKALDLHTLTGDHLDGKAQTLLQAGSLIIGLSSAVTIPTFVYQPPNVWAQSGIAIAFVAFGAMLLSSLNAWTPSKTTIPGENDWNELFDKYLYESTTGCFDKVLSDLVYTINRLHERNARKARLVILSTWLLAVQIVGILILALTA